jgi:PAS domain S-box-containing protein
MNRVSRFAWDRADAWLGLGSMGLLVVVAKFASAGYGIPTSARALTSLAFLLQPYLVARVVRHFRPVSSRLLFALQGAAVIAVIYSLVSPKDLGLRFLLTFIVATTQITASAIMIMAARRHLGLTAWRLRLAALGVFLFGVLMTTTMYSVPGRESRFRPIARPAMKILPVAMLLSYYAGLMPPRLLRRMLQRSEEYRFMRRTVERAPRDRGEMIAADLAEAATRSVASPVSLVLTGRRPLVVAGASVDGWIGTAVDFGEFTPIGRSLRTETSVSGDVQELEPALARVSLEAEQFLMVPIVATGRAWGVLCVTQRRRALFLRDDVDTLRRLCRHAAEILDHAQLLADERARQQREAEAHLDLILESLRDYAVMTIDDTGRITSWNTGAEHVFGFASPAIIGRPVNALFDDEAPWLMAELDRVRAGTPMIADTTGRRRDGTLITASLVIRPLVNSGQDSGGFVIVMRDVSQQRLLEERLRQAQKLEAIGRLAGGVAHDFNNMLTVILGYAASLEHLPTADQRMAVEEIRKAGERAAALTRQLLAFSRRQVLSPRRIELPEVVATLTPMLGRLVGEHIEIVELVEAPVPAVFADPTQIEQIIMNLSVNARDAMPGGGRLTIRLSHVSLSGTDAETLTRREGPHALLEVTDTGSGMDAETQSMMFEPFFTTKEVGRGTGLGLATVYGAVQQMQGAITVDSRIGRGTTFRIYVPAFPAGPRDVVSALDQ